MLARIAEAAARGTAAAGPPPLLNPPQPAEAGRVGAAPRDAAVLQRLGNRASAARWAELREAIGQSFARTDALNLDRKQTILGAFFAIEGAAR